MKYIALIMLLFTSGIAATHEDTAADTVVAGNSVYSDTAATSSGQDDSLLLPSHAETPVSAVVSDTSAGIKKENLAPSATAEQPASKIKLIKRNYNYRQQVVLAIGMMSFIALVMMTAQNWNPK